MNKGRHARPAAVGLLCRLLSRRRLADIVGWRSAHQTPGATAFMQCLAFGCLALAFFLGRRMASVSRPAPFVPEAFSPARRGPPFITVQGTPPPLLPSLVLPPDATAGLAPFAALTRQGGSAMLHGNIAQARSFYERAATACREPPAALLAMGKTFDATVLAGIGAVGLSSDPAPAALWYRRGLSLGDEEARTRLQPLPPTASRAAARAERP